MSVIQFYLKLYDEWPLLEYESVSTFQFRCSARHSAIDRRKKTEYCLIDALRKRDLSNATRSATDIDWTEWFSLSMCVHNSLYRFLCLWFLWKRSPLYVRQMHSTATFLHDSNGNQQQHMFVMMLSFRRSAGNQRCTCLLPFATSSIAFTLFYQLVLNFPPEKRTNSTKLARERCSEQTRRKRSKWKRASVLHFNKMSGYTVATRHTSSSMDDDGHDDGDHSDI